jgi:hypothetical protein
MISNKSLILFDINQSREMGTIPAKMGIQHECCEKMPNPQIYPKVNLSKSIAQNKK